MPGAGNPLLAATMSPPVMEARHWLDTLPRPEGLALINLSQAAPSAPPPPPLRRYMAEAVENDPATHGYGPVLGLPELRAAIAARWSQSYGGSVAAGQVAVTAGCNQAFCVAITTLAAAGDAVILPSPWYFNHRMWLDMAGIEARVLPVGDDLLPEPKAAAALIDARTRAIVLVSPNNPCGTEYPAALLRAFHALCRQHDIALVLDETYRDFDGRPGAPHDLFTLPDWDKTVVQLYSFSKAFRLAGHRVGAMLAAPARISEAEKVLDTLTICPPGLGQRAALWGLRHLADWQRQERADVLARRARITAGLSALDGWRVAGCGAFFAFVEHPFDIPSDVVARELLTRAGVLVLPGTMFGPRRSEGGDGRAERSLRLAFANADAATLDETCRRLALFSM